MTQSNTDSDDAGCCGCIILLFLFPVLIGLAIAAWTFGWRVAAWLVQLAVG